jgi:hypothetical protein
MWLYPDVLSSDSLLLGVANQMGPVAFALNTIVCESIS